MFDHDIVILVDTELTVELCRVMAIFKTKECGINTKLSHVRRVDTRFEIMDAKEVIAKRYSIGGAESDRRVRQDYLGLHPETDGVVDIHVEGLLRSRQLDLHCDELGGQLMELSAPQNCLTALIRRF